MIAKHVPMRSLGKSDFAGQANYITDAQSKDHRLGQVLLTNCAAATLKSSARRVACCMLYVVCCSVQHTTRYTDHAFF